jgi:hypothetical protein
MKDWIEEQKSYIEYLDEISKMEMLEGLFIEGFITNKVPKIFSFKKFYNYAQRVKIGDYFKGNSSSGNIAHSFMKFERNRYKGPKRELHIPSPFTYYNLCLCLSNYYYSHIKPHFKEYTKGDYKISRLHLRKLSDTASIFNMNYNNYFLDPSLDVYLENDFRYVIKADIANCFPSIYTHSIAWAMTGKKMLKRRRMTVQFTTI